MTMGASPAKFLFGFLFVSVILWLIFTFASRLLAWFLSRVMGASVRFRVGGWKCLRDITVKFKKGSVESISVGEIRLSLRQSLVKIGVGIFSRDPKLQVLISDLEVVLRTSSKSTKNTTKKKSRKSRSSGRGKWMVVANMARFLSVSMTELAVKTPKAAVEVKELRLDISKDGGSQPALFVKLHLVPVSVFLGESHLAFDQSSYHGEYFSSSKEIFRLTEKTSAPFNCEDLSILCEVGHDREAGIVVKNVDVTSGEVSVLLTEELLVKKKSSIDTNAQAGEVLPEANEASTAQKSEKKSAILAITKFSTMFPQKIGFTLPKLDVKFVHRGHGLATDNNIMGIQLKTTKSRSADDLSESTRLDVQLEFSEIHLFREAGISIVEILKLDVNSSVYIPLQPSSPIRSEVDIKLGGTQCNLLVSKLVPWMQLRSSKPKKMVLHEESSTVEKPRASAQNAIMWTCTISAPEMTIVLYNLNDLPLYHGCSQSSHIFANNISSTGTAVHMELGELNLHMSDEYQECLKESLFGVETNTGSLLHIAKVSLDWGKKDMDSPEDGHNCKLVLSSDVTGMGVYLTFRRLESLVSTAFSFQALFKKLSASSKKPAHVRGAKSSKPSGKGIQLIKFNLERCSLNMHGEVGLENTFVEDPKRVNYGSQGGRFVISVSADGTPRTADIMSTISDEFEKLKYSVSLDIFHLGFCMNKEKQSTQMELERARSIYHEYLEDSIPRTNIVLLDMQNAKFVRRSGGLKEIAVCSLFSATDISVRWEPDVHIALSELGLQLKLLVHNHKLQVQNSKENISNSSTDEKKGIPVETLQSEKQQKTRESVFAIDVEMLNISAEAGDGVETTVQVQSIFSENARIGVLLEGLMLDLNKSRVFKSSRMQISRVPNTSSNASNGKMETVTVWDWVIQALDVHICMPFRLELRAIDDSFEEMLRALKLITSARAKILFPIKKESTKPKKASSAKIGRVRFCIRKLTADIEEEPIQGWLDEHYKLLKKEACELAVRLNFLDELISKAAQSPGVDERNDSVHVRKIIFDGEEIDVQDPESIQKLRDKIYKQSFHSYYQACQKLAPSPGSGACHEGFQAGFKFSTARSSVLSIVATELDLSLARIDGGDAGMIEVLQKLDPVCRAHNIPFSRLYGSNVMLRTGSLVAHLRNYTCPLFAGTSGRCEGRLVLAQQATCFQPQIRQTVYVGRWRKVCMLRSASGTTPPMKTYCDLPIHFQKAEVSFGVGFEPVFADVSYAFTVALRRANLSIRNPNPEVQPPKKEKSLPWWDEMRNYIHGHTTLYLDETKWNILATTDPYENSNKLQIFSGYMEIQQSDGRVYVNTKDFKVLLSSLESLLKNSNPIPSGFSGTFLEAPTFTIEVIMEWDCDSGSPLNHYLFALPVEGVPRDKIYDPFRSTNLSLRWSISLGPSLPSSNNESAFLTTGDHALLDGASRGPFANTNSLTDSPTINLGPHDLAWLNKFWNLNFLPPHKLRMFSRWTRFGVPRIARSGNLSMDRVMTEFMFRIDVTPTNIRHVPLDDDDPAKGLHFKMTKLKYELCFSRGKEKYTFDSKRDTLDLVYQGVDLHMPKVYIDKEDCVSVAKVLELSRKSSQSASMDRLPNDKSNSGTTERHRDDGFLLSSDYFTIRKQAPKADPGRLLIWQESGRRNLEMTYVRSEFENRSESDEHTRSDPSDDDGYNVVVADNCQRIFVYGLKLLWTIENRDAVWSWAGGISKAFESRRPSPSRLYAQRKFLEENQALDQPEISQDDKNKSASVSPVESSSSPQHVESSKSQTSPSNSFQVENSFPGTIAKPSDDSEGEGTCHFMVNVIEPQFNLHSEEANGRFLLAAVSGRVLARSFHSVLQIGHEMIEQALGGDVPIPESQPEMTWNRTELSVMLEHVQAHVAPTDVDPGAGLQWLPKIRRNSPKVKRTGALLERVFMPCDMYFRYTRHKGGRTDLKVKPLKELAFNSHNITASMTSRQFQIMLDVLTNLLFARLPKPRKSSLSYPTEDDDVEEEADEVVPDGVEEVELARIELEQKERVQKIILDDIRKLSLLGDACGDAHPDTEDDLWMIVGGRTVLIQKLKRELVNAQKSRKAASASLRTALQKAAQLRLMEKEKNKSPSCAMRISLQINKVGWSMLLDGKSFAEAEINDMIYDFDRDYKDIGVARFTTKYFVVRNCLQNAKSDMLLSGWNPPPEWGKKVMLRVDAKQGAPKEGSSPIELFQVEIYPLKIHLTETMYRMMWVYFFPEEDQDSQRRQEVWKVSTTAGSKRVKKGLSAQLALALNSSFTNNSEAFSKSSTSTLPTSQSSVNADSSHALKLQNLKTTIMSGSTPELRRTSSFDRTWEESVAESVANELVLQAHSPSASSLKTGSFAFDEVLDESHKNKSRDTKNVKSGRSSHEEKKVVKAPDDKRSRPRRMREFKNIKISQVELLLTYEGSRFAVSDLRLLMDTFHQVEFTGTWRRLFSRVKKHIIWGVLKSVTGMQGKKFKDKAQNQKEAIPTTVPDIDLNFSDSDGGSTGKSSWPKHPTDGAGDGFVTSVRGLFNSQRRKAKAFVLRTMRGEDNESHGDWSESEAEFSPFARQMTINKAKKLIRRHTKKFRSRVQKGLSSQQRDSLPSSPREMTTFETDSSSESSPYEDFNEIASAQ